MKKRPIKLVTLIIIEFTVLSFVLVAIFGFSSYYRFKNYAIENMVEYGINLSDEIAFMSVDYLFNEAYPSLEFIINEFGDKEDVIGITISNIDNIIVADDHPEHLGQILELDREIITDKTDFNNNNNSSELWFSSPVSIEGIFLGRVTLCMSLANMNLQLASLLRNTLMAYISFFILCLAAGIVITIIIMSPVEKLISAIYESSKGHYNQLNQRQWIIELMEIQLAYNTMAEMLGDRERLLKQARNDAQSANSAKSVFLANISHEFRTPLNGILGFASLLSETELTEEQRSYLEQISFSGESLTSDIRNLLDLVEIETGSCSLNMSEFDIEPLFRSLEVNTQNLLGTKPVEFSYDIQGCKKLIGDRERIEQVLALVLTNSTNFTESGSIKLSSYWQDNNFFVEVTDTGIGISDDELPHVFNHLYQIEDPLTKSHRGIGIGLSMVRMLVDLMDGSVNLNSKPSVGTTVTISLPLKKVEEGLRLEDSCIETDEQELQILLVEDEVINRMYLELVLKKCGYTVDGVSDGNDALEYYKNKNYSIILMDIGLPGMSGIETSEAIFQTEKYRKNPIAIIPVTASTEVETRKKCEHVGMSGFISKPIREELLLETIKTVQKQVS